MSAEAARPEAFGALLRRYRAAAGLSQEELAARAGLSRRAVSDLERGARRRPYPVTARRLAEALQLEVIDRAALLAARQLSPQPVPRTQQRPRAAPHVATRCRLPSQPTALIGRDREVLDLQLRLRRPEVRLLTLSGAGGCGKTRLAVAVATALTEHVAGRVVFVDLSALRDPALVTAAIAGALGIGEGGGEPLQTRLQHSLAAAPTLLVLDNVEQVLDAAAEIATLLAACPPLKLLVTSRIPLRLRWEHQIVVMPLAVPEAAHLTDLEALAGVPSVALFVARAHAVSPDLQLTEGNAAAIALICRRLDGLPLALELAATRTRLLAPQALAARLDRCLPLLTDGPRDVPARQRTLRATIDWSYGLLDPRAQRLFCRLAVFAGGGRLEQVEEVCREPDDPAADVLGDLAALVEQNLVRRDSPPDGAPRLRMLETIGEFAREQLAASGELEALERRHARAFVQRAEAAERTLLSAGRRALVDQLAPDLDNLRAALAWLIAREEGEVACRLAGALTWLWYPLGQVREGQAWAERALAGTTGQQPSPGQAKALFTAGVLAFFLGDAPLARRRLDRCMVLCAELGDDVGAARAGIYLGMALAGDDAVGARVVQDQALAVLRRRGETAWTALALLASGARAFTTGELAAAHALCEESLRLFRQLEDGLMTAEALNMLGDVARASGDDRRAAALYTESLELLRAEGGSSGIPGLLHNLGYLARHRGGHHQAFRYFSDALALFRANGDRRGSAECLAGVASVAVAVGQPARAARLCGAAEATLQEVGAVPTPANAGEVARTLAAARSHLGDVAFAQAQAAGRGFALDQASAEVTALADGLTPASQQSDHPGAAPWLGVLTPREREVAALAARGLSNRQVGATLFITEQTAETHVKRILNKLGLASRHQIRDGIDEHRHGRG